MKLYDPLQYNTVKELLAKLRLYWKHSIDCVIRTAVFVVQFESAQRFLIVFVGHISHLATSS